jgi:branched-chain amino acid transport system permease protein
VTDFIQLSASGLALGAVYALVALGFVIIYRSSQVFNFAHGEFLGVGAFSMVSLVAWLPSWLGALTWPLALAGAMAVTGVVAAGVERAVVRPMIGRPVFVTIILTIFVAFLLRALVIIVWGTDMRGMPTPWEPVASVELFGASVFVNSLGAVVAGVATLAVFFALLKYSKLGIGMRATNNDQEVALALGIPVGRIFASTWFLAGAIAAVAGVFLVMYPKSLDANIGFVALKAFPAVIVGGLTSPVGTVIAGLLLGLSEVLAQGYLQGWLEPLIGDLAKNIHEVFPYVVMILVLMVRPHGLFGHKEVERL